MSDPFKEFLEELERRQRDSAPKPDDTPDEDGQPPRPRARRPGGSAPRTPGRSRLPLSLLLVPFVIAVVFVTGPLVGLITDSRWFTSLGAGELFWQRLQIQGTLFTSATAVSFAFLLIMLLIAGWLARHDSGDAAPAEQVRRQRPPLVDERGQV